LEERNMRRKWYAVLVLAAVLAASTIAISVGNKDTESDPESNDDGAHPAASYEVLE
jgi:hypothetical protein